MLLRLRGGSDDASDEEEEEQEDNDSDVDELQLAGGGSDSAAQRSRAPKRKRALPSYASMPYKRLQALCKKQKLKAAGKKAALIARLEYNDSVASVAAPPAACSVVRNESVTISVTISGEEAASLAAPVAPPPQRALTRSVRSSRNGSATVGGAAGGTSMAAVVDPLRPAESSASAESATPVSMAAVALPPAAELFAQIFDATIVPQAIEMFNDPGGTIHGTASLFGEDISLDPAVLEAMMRRLAFVGIQNGVDIATGAGVINEWATLAEEADNSFTNVFSDFCGRFDPLDPSAEELQIYIDGRKRGGAATAAGAHRRLLLIFPPGHTKGVKQRSGTHPDNILEPWYVDVIDSMRRRCSA